jgi:hypothetical protein
MVDGIERQLRNRPRRDRSSSEMLIYFATDGKRIKIGSTKNLAARLVQLSQHLPEPLKLIGSISGSIDIERAAQAAMRDFAIRGEWFEDTPASRARMDVILSDSSVLTAFLPKREPKPAFIPADVPPERRRAAMLLLLRQMWPDDHVGELAALADTSIEQAERWLLGEEEMPMLVLFSLKGLLLSFMCGGFVENFKPKERP